MNDTPLLEEEREGAPANGAYTAEDLLRLSGDAIYELLDGRLVEKKMGARASEVAANLIGEIRPFLKSMKLGRVFDSDCGYQVFGPNRNRVRKPDVSFVARGRLPNDEVPQGHIAFEPDFAVEVVSPNDLADEVEEKRVEFLQAGVRLVWIIYPTTKTIHVFRHDGSCAVLTESGNLSGDDVLPGFTCRVADLFA